MLDVVLGEGGGQQEGVMLAVRSILWTSSWNMGHNSEKFPTVLVNLDRRGAGPGEQRVRAIVATPICVNVPVHSKTREMLPGNFLTLDKEPDVFGGASGK